MIDWLTAFFLLLGTYFMFVAALGLVRLPDVYMRLSASSKGATLGTAFTMLAVSVHFGNFHVTTQALLICVLILLTSPVSSHLIGRAAYYFGVPLWKTTKVDELRKYRESMPPQESD